MASVALSQNGRDMQLALPRAVLEARRPTLPASLSATKNALQIVSCRLA